MTSFLTRFLERDNLTASYDSLFGRRGVVSRIKNLPKGSGLREEAAVDEYCISLQTLCGFQYVSQAVIMDSTKERIRYYFVFATNSIHGIKAFKDAEADASFAQDEVRHNIWAERQSQIGLPFGGHAPQSTLVSQLHLHYKSRAQERVLKYLSDCHGELSYDEVFAKAMMFPLVMKADLDKMLEALIPHIQIKLKGTHRKNPVLFRGDRISVINFSQLNRSVGNYEPPN
jgi:hypothetical protein